MRYRGRDVQLYLDGKVVALATSCELSVQRDFIEFTSPLTGKAKRNRPGRYGWTVSFESLFSEAGEDTEILRNLIEGKRLYVTMQVSGRNEPISGYAYVQILTDSAPLTGMATCKATLIGDGDIVYTD